jgi:hypothetical protein
MERTKKILIINLKLYLLKLWRSKYFVAFGDKTKIKTMGEDFKYLRRVPATAQMPGRRHGENPKNKLLQALFSYC